MAFRSKVKLKNEYGRHAIDIIEYESSHGYDVIDVDTKEVTSEKTFGSFEKAVEHAGSILGEEVVRNQIRFFEFMGFRTLGDLDAQIMDALKDGKISTNYTKLAKQLNADTSNLRKRVLKLCALGLVEICENRGEAKTRGKNNLIEMRLSSDWLAKLCMIDREKHKRNRNPRHDYYNTSRARKREQENQ